MKSLFASAALAALVFTGGSVLAQNQSPLSGAVVTAVADDGPAQRAGIARGDIILSVDDRDVGTARDVVATIGARQPGELVSVKVSHGDQTKTVQVTLGERNGRPYMGIALAPPAVADGDGRRAADRPILPAFAAIITEVAPGSPAAQAGLQPREVIVSVDGTRLDADHSLGDLIGGRKAGDTVTLSLVLPGGEPRDVSVTLAQSPDNPDAAWLGVRYGTIASRENAPWPRMRNPQPENRRAPTAS